MARRLPAALTRAGFPSRPTPEPRGRYVLVEEVCVDLFVAACNEVAEGNEPLLGEGAFHPVDVFVDPLNVSSRVTRRGVDTIHRSGSYSPDGQAEGETRQSTATSLLQSA
jgi:hypothetical protein